MLAFLFTNRRRCQTLQPLTRTLGWALCAGLLALPAWASDSGWSMGLYAGKYHNQEPASFLVGRSEFKDHYLLAVTASKRLWRAQNWPLELELDAMLGQQWGQATLSEVAVAPVLHTRASSAPWSGASTIKAVAH